MILLYLWATVVVRDRSTPDVPGSIRVRSICRLPVVATGAPGLRGDAPGAGRPGPQLGGSADAPRPGRRVAGAGRRPRGAGGCGLRRRPRVLGGGQLRVGPGDDRLLRDADAGDARGPRPGAEPRRVRQAAGLG